MLEVTAGDLNACLCAFAHILRCISEHLLRDCFCDVFHCPLQFRDGLWLDASHLVLDVPPDAEVKGVDVGAV